MVLVVLGRVCRAQGVVWVVGWEDGSSFPGDGSSCGVGRPSEAALGGECRTPRRLRFGEPAQRRAAQGGRQRPTGCRLKSQQRSGRLAATLTAPASGGHLCALIQAQPGCDQCLRDALARAAPPARACQGSDAAACEPALPAFAALPLPNTTPWAWKCSTARLVQGMLAPAGRGRGAGGALGCSLPVAGQQTSA